MLQDEVLEKNMQLYLQKMEEKHQEASEKLATLQKKLNDSARMIQKRFKIYILKKKTRAALKIQRWLRKYYERRAFERQKIRKFRLTYFSYKLFYFFQKVVQKKQINLKSVYIHKEKQSSILKKVKAKSHQYLITLSALSSQLSYIRKYKAYDKKYFFSQWQIYEKKEREWIWEQIKKKWIKKNGDMWINEQQKEVNVEKYVNNLIEQTYNKHYESLEESQRRLSYQQKSFQQKMNGFVRSHLLYLLFS